MRQYRQRLKKAERLHFDREWGDIAGYIRDGRLTVEEVREEVEGFFTSAGWARLLYLAGIDHEHKKQID